MSFVGDMAMRQAFNHFDKSGDGSISKDELSAALIALGLPGSSFEVRFLMMMVDKDHDKSISFDEFKKIALMVNAGKGKGVCG
jgi:Ca2+-binding EF-hand superfamily protein